MQEVCGSRGEIFSIASGRSVVACRGRHAREDHYRARV